MANEIYRLKALTFGGTTIDGAESIDISSPSGVREGQSDAEMGITSVDVITQGLSGSINVGDEDVDITLLTLSVGVLTATLLVTGGSDKTLTIGLAADSTGVLFTGARTEYNSEPGPTIVTILDFIGKHHADHTKAWGSAAEVAAGTALASITT